MFLKFTRSISKHSPRKNLNCTKKKTKIRKNCLQTLLAYSCAIVHPRVLNMYFEGCLGFNVIQQNGLMSLCGSLPFTQDYVSPKSSH